MVRHLQHIRMFQRLGCQQGAFFLEFHVPGQQHGTGLGLHVQYEGIVIFTIVICFHRGKYGNRSPIDGQAIPRL